VRTVILKDDGTDNGTVGAVTIGPRMLFCHCLSSRVYEDVAKKVTRKSCVLDVSDEDVTRMI